MAVPPVATRNLHRSEKSRKCLWLWRKTVKSSLVPSRALSRQTRNSPFAWAGHVESLLGHGRKGFAGPHDYRTTDDGTAERGSNNRQPLTRIFHVLFVAQTSQSVYPEGVRGWSRVSKPADAVTNPTRCRLGSRRHSRLGSLRHKHFARLRTSRCEISGLTRLLARVRSCCAPSRIARATFPPITVTMGQQSGVLPAELRFSG